MNNLSFFSDYVTEKINISKLNSSNYIGVDNLLINKGGIKESEFLPEDGNAIKFKKGDILLGNIRPYFKKIWLATFDGGCNQDVLCIRSNGKLPSQYLYALLSQDAFFDYDMRGSKGSKMPRGDKKHIMNYPIFIAKKPLKIGELLEVLNDKIKINNKIISELESMSKTLYDYWFIQFDFPNEEGKPYKSSGGKMVYNNELKREIPEGWLNTTLSLSAKMYQPETFDAKKLVSNGKYRVYGAGGFMGFFNEYNHANSETFISCRGSCGNIYRSMPHSLITGNAMIIRSNNDRYKEYLFYTISKYGVKNCITGSVQPQITRDNLKDWKYCFPPISIIEKFNIIVLPIMEKIESITYENQELASLRDFLLPMLMNGQVTFK